MKYTFPTDSIGNDLGDGLNERVSEQRLVPNLVAFV
jgi:hypothetical protein